MEEKELVTKNEGAVNVKACQDDMYIERMLSEREQLLSKYHRGVQFAFSEKSEELDSLERMMLLDQLTIMKQYLEVLSKRIKYAKAKAKDENK